ncbi:septation protein SepH [Blastococcus jejuensis]|uniref:Septation protein SepH n=1 Tax=Blastococcus jejuensis TaxID=351224 RepID=A0ABP6PJP1_9ACTN
MRTLRLVALSDDGKSLILAAEGDDAETGERFELPIDDRVRAAARGDARRLTQIDVDLGTELPPRVIQSRIRSGETPEQVAASSGTRVERIMRFAHPVLQERERVAEQAREARVRLSEGTPSVVLHRFMTERLRLIDADPAAVGWDAYRDDDGTWVVSGTWRGGDKSGVTRWAFDVPARTVTPLDAATMDFAEGTRLVRVVPDVPSGVGAIPVHRASRPVSMLRSDDHPAAPEQDELDAHLTDDLSHVIGVVEEEHVRDVHPTDGSPDRDPALDALLDEVAEHDTVVLAREGEPLAEGEDEDPRARIPAWEDIVFGVRRHR